MLAYHSLTMYFLLLFAQFVSSLSIVPSISNIPAGVRAACRVTLSKNVTQCSDDFLQILSQIPSSSLPDICTNECETALSDLYTEALARCGNDVVNITSNGVLVAIYSPLNLVGEVSKGFCKERLDDLKKDELCSECNLKSIQLDINRPVPDLENSPDDFKELKESCGIPSSSYPINPTSSETPQPTTPPCASTHTATAGDTMNTIAKTLSVSTDRLLTYNGFPLSFNETLIAGEKLCLDQVSKCLIHQVTESDTCTSLKKLAGATVDELMLQSWNPTIGTSCANIKTMLGKYICIGPPGQEGQFTPVAPSTTAPPSTTPTDTYSWGTAPDTVTSTVNITTTWLFPTYPNLIPTETPTLPSTDNGAAIEERLKWCPFKDEYNSTIWDAGLGDEEYHLHSWDLDIECIDESWEPYCTPALTDPVLPSPTDIPSSCLPTVTKIIPEGWVDPPGPTESGVNDNCNKWHLLQNMDTCKSISVKYGITEAQLREYNPSINAGCGNIRAEFAICVRVWEDATTTPAPSPTITAGPPGPTGTGTSPTCSKWHLMVEGDSCDSIAAKYGILVSRFRQLNRSLDASCSNLVKGNAYCVG